MQPALAATPPIRGVAAAIVALGLAALVGCPGPFGAGGQTGSDGLAAAKPGPIFGRVLGEDGKPGASVKVTAYLNNTSPLVGNSGGALGDTSNLLGNAGAGLAGNSGAGLAAGMMPAWSGPIALYRRLAAGVEVSTDAEGRFVITPGTGGVYNVEAVKSDQSKAWQARVKYGGGAAQVDAGMLKLAPTGSISGRVKSSVSTATDFSNTSVYIPGSSYIAITRQDGTYTISNVPTGEFELGAFNVDLGDARLPDAENPDPVVVRSNEATRAPTLVLKTNKPEVTGITVASGTEATDNGAPGAEVDVHGRFFGFARNTRLQVELSGSRVVEPQRLSEELIRITVPSDAKNGNVVVSVGGLDSNPFRFRVIKSFDLRCPADPRLSQSFSLDLGASLEATDSEGVRIVEVRETDGKLVNARPNIAWVADSQRVHVNDRGVVEALSAGSVTVSAKAGTVLPARPCTLNVLAAQSGPTPTPPAPTPTPATGASPSPGPTASPSGTPTTAPTATPTGTPTANPSSTPTGAPTATPTANPTATPASSPTPTPTPAAGVTASVALHAGGLQGQQDGFRTGASFTSPAGLAIDSAGNLVVAQMVANGGIRFVSSAGDVTTLAGGTSTEGYAMAIGSDGTLFWAKAHGIFKYKNNTLTPFVGVEGTTGWSDQNGTAARFNRPQGMVMDGGGTLFVADSGNHCIRKVTPAGLVLTFAGTTTLGWQDGLGTGAAFREPVGLTMDAAGNLYVADTGNHRIRKITAGGQVSTIAGDGTAGYGDAAGLAAKFNRPGHLALDGKGNLLVADTGNHCIRRIALADGAVSTLAGDRTAGYVNGAGAVARFNSPLGLAFDPTGNVLYVADHDNHRIRKVSITYP